MRFFLIATFTLFLSGKLFSQISSEKQQHIDSLTEKLHLDSLHTYRFKKLRPYANIDTRTSYFRMKPVNILGAQGGVVVNEYHTFGIGVYRLSNSSDNYVSEHLKIQNLNYLTFFYEYVLINKRYWEIDLPFEIGWGHYNAHINDISALTNNQNVRVTFVPMGASTRFTVKPVPWIGFAVMGGYRYVIENNSNYLNLNGVYYSLGLWLDIRQVYRDIKYYGYQKKKYKRAVNAVLSD